jgi:hypothetical protein
MSSRFMMLLAIAAPVVGCSVSTEPVDSLNIALAIEPATFHVGDTALLQLTLSNPTSDTIRIQAAQCAASFEIYDHSDSLVARLSQCAVGGPVEVYLPGDQYPVQLVWHGERGPVDDVNPWRGEFLAPGTYTVRAELRVVSEAGRHTVLRHSQSEVRLLPRR